MTDPSDPQLLTVDIRRSDFWNVIPKKLPYLTGNFESSGCRENVVDITHALMDAGFNDTVTIVISFIWEMLEIGAK